MEAKIIYTPLTAKHRLVEVNGHELRFGDYMHGFCHQHQSFDCMDNLTAEEQDAIARAVS